MAERDDPPVTTSSGVVRGRWRGGAAVFLGIPYAAAPVGPRRFGAPEPPEPWSGERDAGRPGATPQRRPLAPVTTIPEPSIPGADILNLNVFTPNADAAAAMPVLVWIHGGGFVGGSTASPWYDGSSFTRDGVVTVAISYRLGFDGFGWIQDAPLNRGLLDQIAALEWVRDNIAAFGGNPDAVTIAGQSAGGSSVLALLTCPSAQPLFRSAICQSAAGQTQSSEGAERMGRELAEQAGVHPTRAGWSAMSEDQILDLQAPYGMPPRPTAVDPVAFARGELFPDKPGLAFGPVVDAQLVPQPVAEALAGGVGADIPLLMGATGHEFSLILGAAAPALADVDVTATLTAAGMPLETAHQFVTRQPELTSPALRLGQLTTERMFRLPLLTWAQARACGGAGDRTWLYDFRWCPPDQGLAFHCTELPFVWDLLGVDGIARVLGDHPPQHLADLMHAAWVRFVRQSNPGWTPAADGRGMVFDESAREADLLRPERQLAAAIATPSS